MRSAPGLGVVGYTLGGGLGPIARAHGFAADHVRLIEFVDATGAVRVASPTENADVFWALRGGGALAIVTSLTFDLFPIQTLDGGAVWFDAADAAAVLHTWREWALQMPESVGTSVALLDAVTGAPLVLTEIRLLGGAVARQASVPNAVAGRDAQFSLFTLGVLAPGIAEAVPGAVEAVLEQMSPWGTGGSLLNFAGAATGVPADRTRAAWSAADHARLLDIRRTLDPTGVFAPATRW